ncbi:MAG: CPBP family intramembrane glutamic endopeptidase, partial [Leuconostoc sp.]|uniref:CPBP family glutamic-type intramembrane protease n=1 Tax=Leuconostoc sp. TaxID=1930076 RepID=UPI0039EB2588
LGIIMSLVTGLMNIGIAVFEELSYRHDLFYRYKSEPRMIVLALLVLSSLLFGFSHFYNFNGSLLGTLLYAVAGLFFGCIYLVTENIWIPILVHVLFKSVSLISAIFLLLFKIIGIDS